MRVLFASLFALLLIGQAEPAAAQMSAPDYLITSPSGYDFADTVDMLKGSIEEHNLMVIQEVDAQRMLRMVGRTVGGMKQVLFFHPRYMAQILDADPSGAIVPPLKIAVMERPDGKVMVRYPRPSSLFAAHEALAELGEELDALVAEIVASLAPSN